MYKDENLQAKMENCTYCMAIERGAEASGSFSEWSKKGKVIEQSRGKIEIEFREIGLRKEMNKLRHVFFIFIIFCVLPHTFIETFDFQKYVRHITNR